MTSSPEPLTVGAAYQLTYNLENPPGTPVNATVTLAVTRPDGTTENPTLTNPTTGTYVGVGACTMAGTWLYRFAATGAATAAKDGQFDVGLAAAPDVYCTVGEVRGHVGDTGNDLDEQLLRRAVQTASRAIDDYCAGGVAGSRRFFKDLTVTARTFWCDDPARAWVDDIASNTGLLVKTDEDGDGVFETTWTVGTDYQLEPLNANQAGWQWWEIVAVGTRAFPTWPQRAGLQVTARFGWPAIPVEVNQAAILKATKLFKRRESPDGFATGGLDIGPVRISRFEDPDVTMLLDPYTKRRTRTLNYTPQRTSLFHGGR